MTTAAVLLAAGSGSRMGLKPKSLLELNGEPLIRRSARQLLDAGVTQLVVVLGHYAADIEVPLQGLPVHKIYNPDPDQGLVSSQRLGLQALSNNTDTVIMSLADQPLVTTQDIRTLLHAFAQYRSTTDMLFPFVNGQPGNPVLLSARARLEILAEDSGFGCKEWRQSHAARTYKMPSENLHFVTDLDRPEDVTAFENRHGMKLQWPAHWAG
jgi:CTP:molybdopterin cytidylyltransferase MocA